MGLLPALISVCGLHYTRQHCGLYPSVFQSVRIRTVTDKTWQFQNRIDEKVACVKSTWWVDSRSKWQRSVSGLLPVCIWYRSL